jgi:uncharacterized protein
MIIIKSGDIELKAEFFDNLTANKIKEILPINAKAQIWGGEIYFEISTHVELDDSAKETVELGDLGFWPKGDCFCVFFGQQPVSAVNIFGKIQGNLELLKQISSGDTLTINKS